MLAVSKRHVFATTATMEPVERTVPLDKVTLCRILRFILSVAHLSLRLVLGT